MKASSLLSEYLVVAHSEVVVGREVGGRERLAVRVQVAVALRVRVAVVRDEQVGARAEYRTATRHKNITIIQKMVIWYLGKYFLSRRTINKFN